MYFEKYLSIYNSTFPCIWVCVISWWFDRLLVEFGHRVTDSPICHHNNLQYVLTHRVITYFLMFIQICCCCFLKRKQFYREAALCHSSASCLFPIYIAQIFLVLSWSTIFSVILDVSPWLCIPPILENRAIISLGAVAVIFFILPLQTFIWDKFLEYGINDM